MDRIKRFIDCYIPTQTCNLRCHYCYITQNRKFNNKLAEFAYSRETICKALSKERLGGTCLLNFCAGGETLLSSEVLPLVRSLIEEGHYAMIVTNGTLKKRFDEVATWPKEVLERLFFKFSFHYLELKRLDLLELFFNNVNLMKQMGASFTVEITPTDELIPYIDEVKAICMEKLGTLCHVTVARDDRTDGIDVLTKYNFEEYKKIWGQFNSELFAFKTEIFYQKRNEFCYAGDWSAYLNLGTGALRQCYCGKLLGNIYEDVNKPIPFAAIGEQCTQPHCYNGHVFLTLGNIPELQTPTYAQMRNRVCSDGSEWLKPQMRALMSSKLSDSNKEYSSLRKECNAMKERWDEFRQKVHRVKVRCMTKK